MGVSELRLPIGLQGQLPAVSHLCRPSLQSKGVWEVILLDEVNDDRSGGQTHTSGSFDKNLERVSGFPLLSRLHKLADSPGR